MDRGLMCTFYNDNFIILSLKVLSRKKNEEIKNINVQV